MKYIFALLLILSMEKSFSTDPQAAYDLVLKGEAVLIDVREMNELTEGMLERAAWFPKSKIIPGSSILKDFKTYTKNKKVFVYCESGKRAEVCKDILRKEGVDAESLGGFKELKHILPTRTIYQRVNDPLSDTEAYKRPPNLK